MMSLAGTPVMRSTRSGQNDVMTRRTLSQPIVRDAMKSWSKSPSAAATWSRPLARARSVPGVSGRCRVACSAVAVRRGSATINAPPFSRCRSKYCMIGGMVSAGLPPISKIGVRAGNVFQRKRQAPVQAERFDARDGFRRHAEAAIVVNVGRPQGDAGELAEPVGFFVGQPAAAEDADRVRVRKCAATL